MAAIDNRYPGKFRARVSLPDATRLTKTFSSRKEAEKWATFHLNLITQIQAAIEKKLRLAEIAKQPSAPGISDIFVPPSLGELNYETPICMTR